MSCGKFSIIEAISHHLRFSTFSLVGGNGGGLRIVRFEFMGLMGDDRDLGVWHCILQD